MPATENARPKRLRPNRPDRIGQTESARPKLPDRKVLFQQGAIYPFPLQQAHSCTQYDAFMNTAYKLRQGSGTYGSRARCDSFDDGIWLAWYFLNTIVTNEVFLKFSIYQTTKLSATTCSTRSRINSKKHVIRENSGIHHCLKLLILLENAHVSQ